jgi:hypothetical protein
MLLPNGYHFEKTDCSGIGPARMRSLGSLVGPAPMRSLGSLVGPAPKRSLGSLISRRKRGTMKS